MRKKKSRCSKEKKKKTLAWVQQSLWHHRVRKDRRNLCYCKTFDITVQKRGERGETEATTRRSRVARGFAFWRAESWKGCESVNTSSNMGLIVQMYESDEEMLLLWPGASIQDKYTSTINPSQLGAKTEEEQSWSWTVGQWLTMWKVNGWNRINVVWELQFL